jgi:hypothetical protein
MKGFEKLNYLNSAFDSKSETESFSTEKVGVETRANSLHDGVPYNGRLGMTKSPRTGSEPAFRDRMIRMFCWRRYG